MISSDDQVEVDLFDSSALEDKNIHPFTNFSIRDYVLSNRVKDTSTNWPFSQKSLQLCMKHDMKDVLPPFQFIDTMKNPFSKITEHQISVSSSNFSQKLPMDIKNINSNQSEEDKIRISALPIKNLSKKSRLILKLKKIEGPNSIQDLVLRNTSAVSETMASKICPVCKSFSSTSNTTLNAHIDECLSEKSTIKEKMNPKVSKHKIKPRKIRLMVDIYKTALDCTLEDLDRRNGTNWAINLEEPAQNLGVCAEGKKMTCSSENIKEFNENSDVYFDSTGRKLQILSKFSDSPKDDCGSRKLVKKDEGNKIFSSQKKNKYLVQKHKLLECPTEVRSGQQREFIPEQGSGKEDLARAYKTYDQMSSNGCEGFKRTGLEKKMNCHYENQHLDKSTKNLRVKNHLLSFNKFKKRSSNCNANSRIQTDINPFLRKRKENLSCNSHQDKYKEKPRPRKTGFPSLVSRDFPGNDNRVFSNMKRLKSVGFLVREKSIDPPNGIENHVSAWNNEKKVIEKKSLVHGISFGDKKFSTLRKNHLSLPKSKRSIGRKLLNFKKPRLCYTSSSDEEAQISRFEICRNNNPFQEPYKNSADMEMGSSGNLKISKKRKRSASNCRPRDLALNGLDTPLVNNSNVDVVIKEVEKQDKFICESTSKIADREVFITFSKSSGLTYEEHYLDELVLGGERNNVFAGEVGETDGNEDKRNYFLGVDPIPIPGPPGSFLPSPGRMGSEEELQGNSSLTSSRVQSSEEDEHELADVYSSDSPISTVLDSVAEKSNHISFKNLSVESHEVHETQFDIPVDRIDQETTTQGFNNGKPCCSRKEEGLQISPLNYQDSQVSKERAMNSFAISSQEMQFGNNFPAFGNIESPSPSPSNSVFRLMGKNLMVVNKDENPFPPQNRPTQSSVANFHPGPPVFDIMQNSMPAQHFGFNSGIGTYDVKNPLYSYPVRGYPIYSMVQKTNTKMPHPIGMNGNWNCSGEGSSHRFELNPLTGSSLPYRGDPRYSMYFSTVFQ